MKPKNNFFAEDDWDEFHEALAEELEREYLTEDDQIERERDLREGAAEDEPDDLINVL
jgi:hypothetical protein